MEQLNILVKVGTTARTILRNCKAIRAITVDELEYYLINKQIDLVIIENVAADDIDRTTEMLQEYINKSGDNSKVIFNADQSDETTLGIADELSCDIYDDTKAVWDYIQNKFKVYVGRDISKIAKDLFDGNVYDNQDIHDIEESMFGAVDSSNSLEGLETDADIKLPDIVNKSSLSEFDDTSMREMVKEQQRKVEMIKKHVNGTLDIDKESKGGLEGSGSETDNFETSDNPVSNIFRDEEASESELDDIYQAKKSNSASSDLLLNQINRLNSTIESLNKKIVSLQGRVDKEIEIRGAISDERDALKVQLQNIIQSKKIGEEKVPATEYRKVVNGYAELQEQLEESKKQSSDLDEQFKQETNKLLKQIDEYKAEIESKQKEINSLSESLNSTKSSGDATAAASAALKAKVNSLTSSLESTKKSLEAANSKIDQLEENERAARAELNNLDRIKHHAEVSDKASTMQGEIIRNTLTMLREYAQTAYDNGQQAEDLKGQLNNEKQTNKSLNDTIDEQTVKIGRLNDQIDSLNDQVKQAQDEAVKKTADLTDANNQLRASNMTLQTQVATLRNQVIARENAYKQLQNSIGPLDPVTKLPRVVASNKMLEARNRELSGQLTTAQQQLRVAMAEDQKAAQARDKLINENTRLKGSLNAYINNGAMGGGAGAGGSGMLPIRYGPVNGKPPAKIVLVFGSGSFGVTQMAFSIAQKTAQHGNVLLMDLDFAAPKTDAYFGKDPKVIVPGASKKMTGSEIFIQNGLNIFWSSASRAMPQAVSNKNGKLWWFPGVYDKIDRNLIVAADWTGLFQKFAGSFDYIVIDAGKLGSGGMSDDMIKNLSNIAYRIVFMSTADQFDIRTGVTLLTNNSINRQRLVWVLNKAMTTTISNYAAGLLGQDKRVVMPLSNESIGRRRQLSLDNLLKGKFEGFLLDNIIQPKNRLGEG